MKAISFFHSPSHLDNPLRGEDSMDTPAVKVVAQAIASHSETHPKPNKQPKQNPKRQSVKCRKRTSDNKKCRMKKPTKKMAESWNYSGFPIDTLNQYNTQTFCLLLLCCSLVHNNYHI